MSIGSDSTAARVRELRERAGLTQRELAIATQLTEKTIQRIEGGAAVGGKAASSLAGYFAVSLDWLLGRQGPTESRVVSDGDEAPLAPEEDIEWAIATAGLTGELAEKFRSQRQSVGPMPRSVLLGWAESLARGKVADKGEVAEANVRSNLKPFGARKPAKP